MKKILIALAAAGMAMTANAATVTVHHKNNGHFIMELDSAIVEAGLSGHSDVTELIIISDPYTTDKGTTAYAAMTACPHNNTTGDSKYIGKEGYAEHTLGEDFPDVDENGVELPEDQKIPEEYKSYSRWDFTQLRVSLREYVEKIDVSQVVFPNDALPGQPYDTKNGPFYSLQKLKEVVLPEGLVSLSGAAFSGCPQLTTVNIPETVKKIGKYCFRNSKNLVLTKLPDALDYVYDGAFAYDNTGGPLTKVTCDYLPQTVATLEASAFKGTSVTFSGTCYVTNIGNEVFNETHVSFDTLADGLKKIGEKAFRNTNVTFKRIPLSCTSVGSAAFVNAPIDDFTLDGIFEKSIPNQCFWHENAVRKFYCRATTPPTANSVTDAGKFTHAFAYNGLDKTTIYVLKEAVEQYEATAPYSSMQVKPLTTTMTLSHNDAHVKISHEHHGELQPGEQDIYEGSHDWTFTPTWNRHITSIKLVSNSRAEGEEEIYALTDEPVAEAPVTVKVPVGAEGKTLVVESEITDPTQTSLEFTIDAEQAPARYYNLMGVEVANPGTGVYIVRDAFGTRKVVR